MLTEVEGYFGVLFVVIMAKARMKRIDNKAVFVLQALINNYMILTQVVSLCSVYM